MFETHIDELVRKDHTYFSVLRDKIGTKKLANLFETVNQQLRSRGLISDIFHFVDASQIISKISLWGERDKAIAAGLEKFNNMTAKKVAVDPQARIGCKGNENYWYGYKRNVAVCMKFGFISKVAITPANVTDAKALKHVCLKQGVVYADKGYCEKSAQHTMQINGCESRAILKNNMKKKDFRRDSEISKKRMPFERVFSKQSKKTRYRGVCKNQFQGFMQALVFNFKRLIAVNELISLQR